MEWKNAPGPMDESLLAAFQRLLGEPEVQVGLTGIFILAAVGISRYIAERPFKATRHTEHRNIIP